MAEFSYSARKVDGDTVSGTVEARDKHGALEVILAGGQTPIRIKQQKAQGGGLSWLQREERFMSARDAGIFCQDLARLLGSGFSLHQALQLVAVSTESKAAKALAGKAADHVSKGGSLSDVLSREKGGAVQALAGLAKAGEAAGRLETILKNASENFSASAAFKDRLTSALIYPVIILFMIAMTLIVFFTFVLPRLEPLFDGVGDRLPAATRWLLAFGKFCETGLPWLLAGLLAGFIAMQMMPRAKAGFTGFLHGIALGRLGFGGARLAGFAGFSRTLGLLINSGVPVASGVKVAAQAVSNQKLAEILSELSGGLREGQSLSRGMEETGLTPEVLVRMSYLGERSGKLGPALIDAAGIIERKAQMRTDRLLAALTPGLTILLGVTVALVVGALFMGIASLTEVEF